MGAYAASQLSNGREDLVLFRDLKATHQQITSSPQHKANDTPITRQFQRTKRRKEKKDDSANSACVASMLDKPVAKP